MKFVYKYIVKFGENELELPKGTEVLSFGLQNRTLVIWARVNADALVTKKHKFNVIFTGDPIKDEWTFLGTVQSPGGTVYHCFYR